MKILALITARGGSKRIPRKNVLPLGGKPLIAWSIEVAQNIDEICDIFVSTDDPIIKDVALKYGANVPFLRPQELSDDTALSSDVAIHALDWYEHNRNKVDGLLLLQPTSPFRTSETIKKGIRIFEQYEKEPVLGVTETHSHPRWMFSLRGEYIKPYLGKNEEGYKMRSQDLEPAYVVNGSFYLISGNDLRSKKAFVTLNTRPLIIESQLESLDIDTIEDWNYAEYAAENLIKKS